MARRYSSESSTLNPDNAAPLYAKDADPIFFDPAPPKYTGRDEYKEGVQKAFFEKMAGGKVSPNLSDLRITQ